MRLLSAVFRRRGDPSRPRRRRPWPGWIRPSLQLSVLLGLGLAGAFTSGSLRDHGWLAVQTSRFQGALIAASAQVGLDVRDVFVHGRKRTRSEDLLAAIDVKQGDPILSFDPREVRARVESLPWVRSATVERSFPDAVRVGIVEREPLALWQDQATLQLVDADGEVVRVRDIRPFRDLPIVVGPDANRHAPALLRMLEAEPLLRPRVTAAVRVSERRWNLRVDDRIEVKLPAENPEHAWAKLANMEKTHGVLQRNIVVVDMRLPDRLVVQLAPGAEPRARGQEKAT